MSEKFTITIPMLKCRFCSALYGRIVMHLPPECFKTVYVKDRLSKTVEINPFDDYWPGVEDVIR